MLLVVRPREVAIAGSRGPKWLALVPAACGIQAPSGIDCPRQAAADAVATKLAALARYLGDAAADGLDGCLDAVVEVKLGEDAGNVVVNGIDAERKLVRNVLIALAAGEAGEDL